MPSASYCESYAEMSQSQTEETMPSFAMVGWTQEEVIVAFGSSAVSVMVRYQPWAQEHFREEKENVKRSGPTVAFDCQIEGVTVELHSVVFPSVVV